MGSREIVTLQFGHYSNYVGAHWWNIQEMGFDYTSSGSGSEIDHDVLFREGLTLNGQVTFTPRLLLVDLQGSLKALPEEGNLYNDNDNNKASKKIKTSSDSLGFPVEIKNEKAEEKIPFQKDLEQASCSVGEKQYDLDENVRVWSDFLYTRFHPRTVNIIKEYQHKNEFTKFDCFPSGMNLWNTDQFKEDFTDKIRNYAEECDSLQGFHIVTDCEDAFGGLSSSCLQYLQDDYSSKSLMTVSVVQSKFLNTDFDSDEQRFQAAKSDWARLINLALAVQSLAEYSSLVVPLSTGTEGFRHFRSNRQFNHVLYDPYLPYHSSAILASALDTFTLRYRLKNSEFSLTDVCKGLSSNNRKVSAASVCLPFGLNKDQDLIDCLNNWEGPLSRCITPNCDITNDDTVHLYSVRGILENRLKRPTKESSSQKDMPAYQCKTVKQMFEYYMECTLQVPAGGVTVLNKPLAVKTPYPRIFGPSVDFNGDIRGQKSIDSVNVSSVPVLAGLHTGSGVGSMLELLHGEVTKCKFRGFHQFHTEGLDLDDFEQRMDDLQSLRESYDDSNYYI